MLGECGEVVGEGGLMKGLRHRSTSRLDEINWQFTLSLSCVLHLTIRQ